jgi:hypothetical protein
LNAFSAEIDGWFVAAIVLLCFIGVLNCIGC